MAGLRAGGKGVYALNLAKILADLREQRDQIEEAIVSLERLEHTRARRRGRPPGSRSKKERTPSALSDRESDWPIKSRDGQG